MRNQPNSLAVTKRLLEKLNVKYTNFGLKHKLEQHPNYPSLLAVSDVLTEYGVDNLAKQIDKSDYVLLVGTSFVAFTQGEDDRLLLVIKIADGEVLFSDGTKETASMPIEAFLDIWTGIVFLFEASDRSIEPNYLPNKVKGILSRLKVPLLVLGIVLFLMVGSSLQGITMGKLLITILYTAGTAVSILLLVQSLDANNPLVRSVCGGKGDCNSILRSEAANVTSWLTWSEVGFFYFSGSLLTIAVYGITPVAWLNILALPYTVYSISYQYSKRHWCILCCIVQVLICGIFITSISTAMLKFDSLSAIYDSLNSIYVIALCFVMPILVWYFLKPFFQSAIKSDTLQKHLNMFKYNNELFMQALTNQQQYLVNDDFATIKIGNPNANYKLTIVSNPLCLPCAMAHGFLERWMKTNKDLQLEIVFNVSVDVPNDGERVVSHLNTLVVSGELAMVEQAVNSWYSSSYKKYSVWSKDYPVEKIEDGKQLARTHKKWIKTTGVKHTPTIFINGYKLPDPYRLEDLQYLIG